MKLESFNMTYFPPLADDYINRFDVLQSRFDFSPQQKAVYHSRAAWLDETETRRAGRAQIADLLKKYNARLHNSKKAMDHIEQLAHERALVIVGGQQAGLFTGPLLVIYKAISVIQQAKKASLQLNRPVIPLFWIAGEDHDLDEVDHIYFPSATWQVEKLQLARQEKAVNRLPVSEYVISGADWEAAIKQLEKSLGDTPFSADLFHKLRMISAQSKTLTDSFARLIAWLFADEGLVLLDSADPCLRQLEAPMMSWLVHHADELNAQFMQGSDELKRLGYKVQAPPQKGQANLFYVDEHGRTLLQKQHGQFVVKSGVPMAADELKAIAIVEPEKLSNNVLTRPLMQEYVLPVLGTVLGGSELAYWAQLKEGFRYANMKLPILLPRARYTLLEGTLIKLLHKFDWGFDDVYNRWQEKRQLWLDAQDELNLDEQFHAARQKFFELYDPLLNNVKELHPGMMKMADKNKQKIEAQMSFLQKRINDAYELRHDASLKEMERLFHSLKPLDQPQERVYNIVAYLNKYGFDWLKRLTEMTVDHPEHHHLVYL